MPSIADDVLAETIGADFALTDSDNLPPPDLIAQEIVDDLEAALEQFRLIAGDMEPGELPVEQR